MLENVTLLTAFLYVIGLVLLLIEAVIPGFGVAGIGGSICVVASIAMIANSFYEATLMIIGTAAILVLVALLLYKLGIGKRAIGKFILNTTQTYEGGYTSNLDYRKYIGMSGYAVTPLRSAGSIIIGNDKLDAVSEGDFIEKGAALEVIRVEGRRIVVREIEQK